MSSPPTQTQSPIGNFLATVLFYTMLILKCALQQNANCMQTLNFQQSLQKTWKWSMQTGGPLCWPRNLIFFRFDGGQVPQRCLFSRFISSMKCFGLSPQVHTLQGTGLFWLT